MDALVRCRRHLHRRGNRSDALCILQHNGLHELLRRHFLVHGGKRRVHLGIPVVAVVAGQLMGFVPLDKHRIIELCPCHHLCR